MSIEAAVRWAVRDELPKVGAAAGAGAGGPALASPAWLAFQAGQLGARVSSLNVYGVMADLSQFEQRAPHPDAIRIGDAMLALDACRPADFEHWEPFDDLGQLDADPIAGPLLAEARQRARARASADHGGMAALGRAWASGLMVRCAVLGAPAGWEAGEVTARVVASDNGMPLWFRRVRVASAWNGDGDAIAWEMIEVDGRDPVRRRPYPDAYRKHELTPDPIAVATARADWQVWRAALDVLFEDLAGRLETITLQPCGLPWRPWAEGQADGPRVLDAVGAGASEGA